MDLRFQLTQLAMEFAARVIETVRSAPLPEILAATETVPVKRKRGRPPGSKNKTGPKPPVLPPAVVDSSS